MSFATWKKRSSTYHDTMRMNGIGRPDAERVARAAFLAGVREGRERIEDLVQRAIVLRGLLKASTGG